MPAVDAAHQVGNMQKSRPVQANVYERGLHARQHPSHLAQIDIADEPPLKCAFNLQLLHRTVFNHGNPRLLRRPINQDVLLHYFFEIWG